mmetsp:Transcript_138334/g.430083  ORF Transcript_138334/g.430083 Transcript_138334/m.430083 type:complete len:209 (-) Transcript_138334:235-861(-)
MRRSGGSPTAAPTASPRDLPRTGAPGGPASRRGSPFAACTTLVTFCSCSPHRPCPTRSVGFTKPLTSSSQVAATWPSISTACLSSVETQTIHANGHSSGTRITFLRHSSACPTPSEGRPSTAWRSQRWWPAVTNAATADIASGTRPGTRHSETGRRRPAAPAAPARGRPRALEGDWHCQFHAGPRCWSNTNLYVLFVSPRSLLLGDMG